MKPQPDSKSYSEKALHVVLGIRAVKIGVPGVEDGKQLSFEKAGHVFPKTSKSALHRMCTDEDYTDVVKQIVTVALPEDIFRPEMDILARSFFALLPQHGGQTILTPAEEFALVENAVQLSQKGFSMDTATLEAHALTLALTNHPDHTVAKRWLRSGVSREWRDGFMQRWGHLLSMRWGEDMCGQRRQVMKGQCLQLYEILQELGEDVGVIIGSDGKKRLAPHELANLDETCMRMLSKMSPVLVMKGTPKALRAEHKNYRESQTLLLTIFADGVARVPPFLIVNGSEGDEGTFSQPAWWGTREDLDMLKGTMMEHSAIAQQKNAYMTNQMFVTWTLDCFIQALGARKRCMRIDVLGAVTCHLRSLSKCKH